LTKESARNSRRRAVRDILIYGVCGGVLVAVLKLMEYRFLVVEHSVEIYAGLVAALFAGLGIWLGLTLTRKKPATDTGEIQAQTQVQIKDRSEPFRRGRDARAPAGHYRARTGDSGTHSRWVEQSRDCRPAVREREHGEDAFKPAV
jgi:hypothetical protein